MQSSQPLSADVDLILCYLATVARKVFKTRSNDARAFLAKARILLEQAEKASPDLVAALAESLRRKNITAEHRALLAELLGSLLLEFNGLTKAMATLAPNFNPADPRTRTPEEAAQLAELKGKVKDALATLDVRARIAVVARCHLGWTFQRIGERVGFVGPHARARAQELYVKALEKLEHVLQEYRDA